MQHKDLCFERRFAMGGSWVWLVRSRSCSSTGSLTPTPSPSPDEKDIEIAVLRHQLAYLHRQFTSTASAA